MHHRRAVLPALGLAALGCRAPLVWAGALPPPTGDVLLTVSGAITVTNGDGVARLDRAQLMAWGPAQLRTTTPWTEGETTFEGVFGDRLLKELGSRGTQLRCTALNDYSVEIPVEELLAYTVLFALMRDGVPLSPRERGPIWVVYPWSQRPELDDRLHRQRSIWQLTAINVR
jgi:hypothetical protein